MPLYAVIFHGNCPDALAGLWLLGKDASPGSLFFPVNPSDPRTLPDPETLVGHKIAFMDVCFSPDIMKPFQEVAEALGQSVLVLDHHPLAASVVAVA